MSGDLLVVSQMYPPETGGNASRIDDLTTYLAEDWNVTVVAPPPSYPPGEFDRTWRRHEVQEDGDVTVDRLWTWQPGDVDPSFPSRIAYYAVFALHAFFWTLVHRGDYDVVLTSSPPLFTGFVAAPFSYLLDTPWVLDVRDVWIDVSVSYGFIADGGLVERACKRYRAFELRTADLVTVTTEGTVDQLAAEYDLAADVAVLPNGVDADEFAPDGREERAQIVYAGNVGHCQDLEPCVRAMDHVEAEVTFRIVGDGDAMPRLREIVAEEGLGDAVVFEGLVDRERVSGYLDESAIGLAPIEPDPSLEYAVPTKVFEYMACELPVIAVGAGEIRRVIEESGGGVMAESDPEAIAAHIDDLLADDERRAEMSERGRAFVVDRYHRKDIAAELSGHLQQVASA